MASDSLTYFRMLPGKLIYGPVKKTITDSESKSSETETFVYSHRENTSSSEFSMTNEISISGVLKAFDIGASHSHSFSKASAESLRTGNEMRQVSQKYVSGTTTKEYDIKDDTFLCQYAPIKVVCFTINGGARHYCTIPAGSVTVRPVGKEDLQRLSDGSYLLDKETWGSVAAEYPSLVLDDIRAAIKQLVPRDIKVEGYVAPGTYKIKTTYHPNSGCPAGWGLSAWRTPSDGVRNHVSTWVAAHAGDEWPCLWEIKPGREEGTYQIVTKQHTKSQHPGGWGLSAFPLHGAKRNHVSTRIAVHEGSVWPMDWKIVKNKSSNTYKILTTDHFAGGQVPGWGLSAWGPKISDTLRNHVSCWVHVHEGNYWPMNWELEKQD